MHRKIPKFTPRWSTLAAARHAAEHGWIGSDALAEIGAEKRDDEHGPTKVDAPGAEPMASRPTIVVDESGAAP